MGGNIFDTAKPIPRDRIFQTLLEFKKTLENIFLVEVPFDTIGSVFKKDMSGDLDIATDENDLPVEITNLKFSTFYKNELSKIQKRSKTATQDQMERKALLRTIVDTIQLTDNSLLVDTKRTTDNSIHLLFPQYDYKGMVGEWVQIDWMFGDLEWLKFSYNSSSYEGNVKGLHRTQLLVAIFSSNGYTFSHGNGVKRKGTDEWIWNTPEQILEFMRMFFNKKDIGMTDLYSYEMLYYIILDSEHREKIFDTYLKILDSTRCDIPLDLQEYWIENRERLGLTGKFLPEDSKLKQSV